jgi:hypothetical protein
LECDNKLFTKVKLSRKDEEIAKCYWACINTSEGCKAMIQYDIDLDVAGLGQNGIINIVAKDHDIEYCDTNADDILVRNARKNVLVKETEG